MKIKRIFATIMLAACTYVAVAQNTGNPANNKTFFVAKPGTLVSMLTEDEANSITHLTLTGKLNAIDFKHLRDEFKNLQVLDISNASISTYAGKAALFLTASIYIHQIVYLLMHSASKPMTVPLPENQRSGKLFFQRKSRT